MKKFLMFLFFGLFLFVVSGCTESKKNDLEKFIDLLEEKQNCEMKMEMTVPMLGKVTITAKADGNKGYVGSVLGMGDIYTEEVDGKIYQYYQDLTGKWVKEEIAAEDVESEFDIIDELEADDFDKIEDKKYELKEEKREEYNVESFVITLTDDGAIFEFEMIEEGLHVPVTLTITKIGEVEIQLPKVD
ncbi:MAG TPA: hypothetical protein GXZ48_05005 [Acholeplasmataceae bacterium]|jgi:hypothetical protein|nr:hypothetical protein [Acholeplasmataceae bacterium]